MDKYYENNGEKSNNWGETAGGCNNSLEMSGLRSRVPPFFPQEFVRTMVKIVLENMKFSSLGSNLPQTGILSRDRLSYFQSLTKLRLCSYPISHQPLLWLFQPIFVSFMRTLVGDRVQIFLARRIFRENLFEFEFPKDDAP